MRTTLQILEAVAEHQPIGLSDLARRIGLPKSTVQRSLATLADLGWIRPQRPDSALWAVGGKVRTLSESIDDVGRLREACLPTLERLNRETRETVHLAVHDGDTVRLIERQDSPHPLRLVKAIGSRSPLHAGSTGKAVLAHLPEAELEAYLAGSLECVTPHTTTDPTRLRGELARVREQGYAVADQELTEGIVSVASCIPSTGGRPFAALSVSAPATRMPAVKRTVYAGLVVAAAAEITRRLDV